VPTPQSPKQRRPRCKNCNKLFTRARNVPDQKFCKDACRKEFWLHGSAFGPMKAGLYSAIDKKYRELERETNAAIRAHRVRIDGLVDENRTMRALLQKALDRFEGHTHSVQEYTDYGATYMEAGPPQIVAVERVLSDASSR
jgi:hypothetical protein